MKMHKSYHIYFLIFVIALVPTGILKAQSLNTGNDSNKKLIDQVVAVVNSHVILKSDVDKQVRQLLVQLRRRRGNVQFSRDMWYSALQQLVNNKVLLIHARLDSVTVSEDRVSKSVQQQVNYAINMAGGQAALEDKLGKSIFQLKAKWRKQSKKRSIIRKYRQKRLSKVSISRPEVRHFFHQFPADSIPVVPEKVAISQIVILAPPKKNAVKKARHLAKQIRDSIVKYGKSFEKMAKKYSDGPAAPYGGRIPMYPIDKLTPDYAAAASALEPGEISKVIKTPFGFHIIRLNKRRGNKIDTNNILISLDESDYNTQAAIQKLKSLRDSILSNPDVSFAEIARKKSDDPNTSSAGGRIINPRTKRRFFKISQLAPSMFRIVLLLDEPGDISKPKPFTLSIGNGTRKAYRIVRLDAHIPKHKENLKQDFNAIKRVALEEKKQEVFLKWIKNLKKDINVDYKIPLPKGYSKIAQR